MRRRSVAFATALACLTAGSAAAQDAGTVELGVFGRYTSFSSSGVPLTNYAGIGFRAGYFLSPMLSLEADVSRTRSHNRFANAGWVTYYPYHLRGVVHLPFSNRLSGMLGLGPVINSYRRSGHDSDLGIGGLAGVRIGLTRMIALRLDATADYALHRATGGDRYWNFGTQAGISVLLGTKRGESGAADADGDGISNALDRCPGSPAGSAVDPSGCTQRADTDRDGVIDINDLCPNTPSGAKVDANGCSGTEPKDQGNAAAPAAGSTADSDNDGIMDSADKCPNTPAGQHVDTNGCAMGMDADGDGVMDDRDRCPSSRPGEAVDATGCRAIFAAGQTVMAVEDVTFEHGGSTLTDRARQTLYQVAQSLAAHAATAVEVAGFGDAAGDTQLGQARADTVRAYLMQNGVAEAQLTAKGYAPAEPAAAGRIELRQK